MARYLAGTTEYRELERMLDKASHDEAQALYTAERRGKAWGVEKTLELMQKGYTPDQIREVLSKE